MKWNSLLPAKVACGADLQQLWNDIENSQATHIKQSKIINTSQARTCSQKNSPCSFKTWKAKSWIVNCQDLGAWNCRKVAFQNLAGQVLNKKRWRFQTAEQRGWHVFMSWKTKSWKNCWHRSNVELIYPQQFQDLESQILNTALSRLGGMELQKCDILNWACQVLNKLWLSSSMFCFNHCHLFSFLGRPNHERHKSWTLFMPDSFKT